MVQGERRAHEKRGVMLSVPLLERRVPIEVMGMGDCRLCRSSDQVAPDRFFLTPLQATAESSRTFPGASPRTSIMGFRSPAAHGKPCGFVYSLSVV